MGLISSYVEAMFATLPQTKDIVQMKLNIISNMEEKFDARIAEGKNEDEVLGSVIAEFGNIDEIKKTFGIPDEDAAVCGSGRV